MICSTCAQDKNLHEFHPNRRFKTGYGTVCKTCYIAAIPTTLICVRCGIEQPLEAYARDTTRRTGRQQPCNTCRYEPKRAYRLANPTPRQLHRLQSIWLCNRCGEEKPVEDFKTKTASPTGHTQPCKTCCNKQTRERSALHAEQRKEYGRQYRKIHRERERLRAIAKRNRDLEKYRADKRAARAANRASTLLEGYKRRTRRRELPHQYTDDDRQFMLQYWGYACAVCGRQEGLFSHKLSDDHWIPINSPDCPGTIPTNMLPLCLGSDGCNNSKGDDDGREWLIRRYGKHKGARILKAINTYFAIVRERAAQQGAAAD